LAEIAGGWGLVVNKSEISQKRLVYKKVNNIE